MLNDSTGAAVRIWVAPVPITPSALSVTELADRRWLASLPRIEPPVTVRAIVPLVPALIVPTVALPPLTPTTTLLAEDAMLSRSNAPVCATATLPVPLAIVSVFAAVLTSTAELAPPAVMATVLPVIPCPDVAVTPPLAVVRVTLPLAPASTVAAVMEDPVPFAVTAMLLVPLALVIVPMEVAPPVVTAMSPFVETTELSVVPPDVVRKTPPAPEAALTVEAPVVSAMPAVPMLPAAFRVRVPVPRVVAASASFRMLPPVLVRVTAPPLLTAPTVRVPEAVTVVAPLVARPARARAPVFDTWMPPLPAVAVRLVTAVLSACGEVPMPPLVSLEP